MKRILLPCFLTLFIFPQLKAQVTLSDPGSTNTDTTRTFERVEVEASFPGGEQAWRKFLEKNLNPNVPVDNRAPAGRYNIYVQFIVNKEGRVSDIKTLTKEGYGMEQESIRIINKSGLWTPAIQNGRTVNAYRKQPITFQIEQEGLMIHTKTPFVLYANTANQLTIDAGKIKSGDLDVTISQGTIVDNGDGTFTARVTKPGRVLVTVYNKKKKNKLIGTMSFEVFDVKPPAGASN